MCISLSFFLAVLSQFFSFLSSLLMFVSFIFLRSLCVLLSSSCLFFFHFRYCLCKALLQYPLVMQMSGTIAPLARSSSPGGSHRPSSMPRDFYKIVGSRLPFSLYFLMSQGVLSRKLPSVLAQQGEWCDYSHPCVDSIEYRELLIDVREYRCRALGKVGERKRDKETEVKGGKTRKDNTGDREGDQ